MPVPVLDKGGKLRVKVTMEGLQLHCSVEDNGVGRQAGKATPNSQRISYGTTLAGKLMEIWQTDKKSQFAIEDLADDAGRQAGSRATLVFPYLTY